MVAEYFASLPTAELGGELHKRVNAYYEACWRSGRLDLWRASLRQYNKTRETTGRVLERGQQGEYLTVAANHYASIISTQLALITSQKIAWDPKASNTDFRSQTQTILAKGLLDYYVREKRLDAVLSRAAEFCVLYGEAGVCVEWDPLSGDVHAMDEGNQAGAGVEAKEAPKASKRKRVFAGDISASVYSPIDIIRDHVSKRPMGEQSWTIIRKFRNKFELAHQFEEYEDEIKHLSYRRDDQLHDSMDFRFFGEDYELVDSDEIPLYVFYHKITPLLPEGRMVEFLTTDIVLTDSPLPYEDMPLKWIAYREEDEHPYGYSSMWDLLPLQTVMDALLSTLATNHKHFGLNILMVPRGQGWDITKSATGLSVIEVDPALPQSSAPQSINLLGQHNESMNFMQMLQQAMETLPGVNSVARGNPEASLKSGAALALVQSMAIQSSQPLQKSYYRLLEDVGTTVISHLKFFAEVPRVAEISGKSKRGVLTEFSATELQFVNRVTVEAGSALSKTLAGRVNLAELLLQQGVLKDPDALLQVLETGNIESVLEGDMSRIQLIRAENEALESGEYPVQALITDDHLAHIREHPSVLSSPSARQDAALVQRCTDHLQQHIQMLMDPNNAALLAALGQQSMAPPPAPPNGDIGAAVDAQPADQAAAENVNLPSAPKNAMTGEEAPLPVGGP